MQPFDHWQRLCFDFLANSILLFKHISKNQSKHMKKQLLLSLSLSMIFSCLFAQTPDEYSFKKSFKMSTPADMSISTNDGYINVIAKNTDQIEVFFIVKKNNKVYEMDLEELEEHLDVDISSSNDDLEITIKQKESSWIKNWKDRYYVSLHILAPERTSANLRTSDGDIDMTGLKGNQNCKTSDGDIHVENIVGDLYTKTSDGNIIVSDVDGTLETSTSDGDIKAANIKGEASFRTSDGDITVGNVMGDTQATTSDGNIILEEVKGDHTARTSDGNIVFEDMQGSITAQTSDGNIKGDLNSLTNKLYLKTSDGDITVAVPDGIGMDISLRGEDINMRLEDFSGETSDHKIEGTIRGGGVEVELITSDGNINLNYN